MGLVSRKSFLNWFVNQYRSVTEYLFSCSSFTTSFSSAIVRGWYGHQRIATILGIPLYLARTYRKTSTDDLYGRVERHAEGMSASTSWHFEWLEDGPGRPPRLDLPTRLSSFCLSLSLSLSLFLSLSLDYQPRWCLPLEAEFSSVKCFCVVLIPINLLPLGL